MDRSSPRTNKTESEILISLNEAVANVPSPEALFQVIYETLRPVFHFDLSAVILPTESQEYGEIFLQAVSVPDELRELGTMRKFRIDGSLSGFDPDSMDILRFETSEIHRLKLDFGKELEIMERSLGIQHFTLCPLVHSGKIIGHLILGNGRFGPIEDEDIPLLQLVSRVIAAAVASTSAFAKLSRREQEAQRLLNFTTALLDIHETQEFFTKLAQSFYQLRPFVFGSAYGLQLEELANICATADAKGVRPLIEDPIPLLDPLSTNGPHPKVQVIYYDSEKLKEHPIELFKHLEVHAAVQVILRFEGYPDVILTLAGNKSQSADLLTPGLLEQVGIQLFISLQTLFMFDRTQSIKNRLQLENRILFDEMAPPSNHSQMIGQSPAFRKVLSRASLVAPNDTTVLLLGETGTGKEVLARFLHDSSLRHEKPMVRVNCASLPAQLIESELFGHEKGSFTGAVDRRLGKFELAQGGTIFLDEIGELPLESQAKLLRVLQEREFERVGGHQILHADVRVIAATNRDLAEEARKGTFRPDLYFRISVFSITLPPLRDRKEDIPLLAEIFLQRAAKKIGHTVRSLEREELDLLTCYSWPGNIRELEHVMENAAILAKNTAPNFRDFRKMAKGTDEEDEEETIPPLEEIIRSHILKALRRTKGRVGGPNGAASLLHLNSKTLDSKMRKLGIQRTVGFN
ncbi:MAG TPA: sigma 54-interacting transcriptional regulator [Fibrobacteraceae bacterium]|nr:sigma 54-interacting transcriptional regulator [Fibrobacteraceae bacterium]